MGIPFHGFRAMEGRAFRYIFFRRISLRCIRPKKDAAAIANAGAGLKSVT